MTMTKWRIIELISEKTGLSRRDSTQITESLIEIVKSSLSSGDDVLISGFGKFCVKEKAERRGDTSCQACGYIQIFRETAGQGECKC